MFCFVLFCFPLNSELDCFISKFKNKKEMHPFEELCSSLSLNHSVLATLVYFLPFLKCPRSLLTDLLIILRYLDPGPLQDPPLS